MLFKLSNLNSNLALTVGYLNPALNNSAQECLSGILIFINTPAAIRDSVWKCNVMQNGLSASKYILFCQCWIHIKGTYHFFDHGAFLPSIREQIANFLGGFLGLNFTFVYWEAYGTCKNTSAFTFTNSQKKKFQTFWNIYSSFNEYKLRSVAFLALSLYMGWIHQYILLYGLKGFTNAVYGSNVQVCGRNF